jgi:5-methylcytosine-specific restriction endonuclease McrA
MNVDHIKPRKQFPWLALDIDNCQILCQACNHGKGNWSQTDWRPDEIDPSVKAFIKAIADER